MNPRWLGQFFPNSKSLHDPDNILYRALAGPASGLATTLFMALLPQIFKLVAYYEGTSSSLEMAERKALLFMWYFMLVTAFFGQYLATMLIQWYYHSGVTKISQSLWSTVNTVATLIPSAIAPQWLNWIIIRYGFIWPGGYFFQMNTFLTKISRMTCLNRVARGGGAGGRHDAARRRPALVLDGRYCSHPPAALSSRPLSTASACCMRVVRAAEPPSP